ncbi:unnamed protein product [Didymodactylos carnosus]|nr:unnamed protein product [Didymodactylos carnosus]CAF3831747.1 unnamed protein product [Didymodactylos carnosus]
MKSVFFALPYYGRETLILGQRIKKLARQLMVTVDMKIAYRKTLTLQNVFLSLQKGLDVTEKEKNLVYSTPCMDCDYKYYGHTARDWSIRINEHRDKVRLHSSDSKIVQHVEQLGHTMDFKNAKVEAFETSYRKRVIKEALFSQISKGKFMNKVNHDLNVFG